MSFVASLGWRIASRILIRQSPLRVAFSLAATLVRQSLKLKVDAWINRRQQRTKANFLGSMRMALKKTISWTKRDRNTKQMDRVDAVALGAGLKYKELAEQRLNVAKAAFEAASVELRAAERGFKDAERYVKSLISYCENVGVQTDIQNDFVLVEHADADRREAGHTHQFRENGPTCDELSSID